MSDRRTRTRPEERLQRAVIDYLRVACPQPPEGPFYFHVPNQRGTRKKFEMGVLKALGVVPGIPDLLFVWRGRLHGVELKAGRNEATDAQDEAQQALTLAGAVVTTCRSVEEVDGFLRACGVPVREVRIV